jgi:carbonic anhydrase
VRKAFSGASLRIMEAAGKGMETLLEGVRAFRENYFKRERGLFESLAERQEPQALFITCSDSRIDPNLLTQTRPGEIFVMRNAGNIVPSYDALSGGESATIEYAVAVLKVSDIIVCGHSNCGAMKALINRESLAGLPAVASWLAHAGQAHGTLFESGAQTDDANLLDRLIEKNVLIQLENLRTHPAVACGIAEGSLRLHGWVYRIHAGDVLMHDPARSKFIPALEQIEAARRGGAHTGAS